MMELHDNLPVIELPDGRRAIVDTGFSGAEILSSGDLRPVDVNGRFIHPTISDLDLDGIGREIGAPRLDLLIGAAVLYEGFTVDLRNRSFVFAVEDPLPDEEVVAVLPYSRPYSGAILSPAVELGIGDEKVSAVFDTGAPYSLWKRRAAEPDRPAEVTRTDFHVANGGQITRFPVLTRRESIRIGSIELDLNMAYLPDSFPAFYPDCVIGMDVPKALSASRFLLDPDALEIRFYRTRRI